MTKYFSSPLTHAIICNYNIIKTNPMNFEILFIRMRSFIWCSLHTKIVSTSSTCLPKKFKKNYSSWLVIHIGYARLINYWSNEYGGNILYIDELYVKSDYRSLGIQSTLFSYIEQHVNNNTVALCLKTFSQNKKA